MAGLKDVDQAAADRIEEIIVSVLRELFETGIDKNLIDSAIHQIEFHRKEITNTPYPYGIKLLLTFSGSRFHGGDPVKVLNFDADLTKLQNEMAKGGKDDFERITTLARVLDELQRPFEALAWRALEVVYRRSSSAGGTWRLASGWRCF